MSPLIAVIKPHRSCANVPEHWRYPFLPTASAILEEVNLESLLEDYFYAEARALAINRLETSATRGIIDIEGPPTNDENDIVLGYVIETGCGIEAQRSMTVETIPCSRQVCSSLIRIVWHGR